MKLSASVDLTPVRGLALNEIGRAFERRFFTSAALTPMYAYKVALADAVQAGHEPHECLVAEAKLKGITIEALAADIIAKNEAANAALMAIEIERQTAKAQINAAADQHTINAIVQTIIGAS